MLGHTHAHMKDMGNASRMRQQCGLQKCSKQSMAWQHGTTWSTCMSMIMHSITRHNKHKIKQHLQPKEEHHHARQHVQAQHVQQQSDILARCTLTMMGRSLNRSMRNKSMRSINIATHLPHGQRAT